ncbi:LURP-one-related 5 protein [Nymphaea thermarum]|nr:LURP-one-related 5 protein [Nymphaea thermarum]
MSQEGQAENEMVEEGCFCFEQESLFTVSKTSHFFAGDGFNVYDSKGEVVFRVDNYGGPDTRDRDEVVLMDAQGNCILTVRKKSSPEMGKQRPSLHHRWEGFEGERKDGQKPSFSVRRSSIIGTGSSNTSVTVEVYGSDANSISAEYQIEGSYPQRSCTVYDSSSRETLVEVRRKKVSDEVVLGKDVFCLCVKAGFDSAFAMGMVLVLDQIYGDQPATTLHDAPAITPTQQQLPLETS